jgi:hypothetical protein
MTVDSASQITSTKLNSLKIVEGLSLNDSTRQWLTQYAQNMHELMSTNVMFQGANYYNEDVQPPGYVGVLAQNFVDASGDRLTRIYEENKEMHNNYVEMTQKFKCCIYSIFIN